MALLYTQLASPIDMNGNPVELAWQAQDDVTGVTIMQNFPLGTTDADAKAALATAFPANPTVNQDKLEPLRVFRVGNSYKVIDENGKPLMMIDRDVAGNASVEIVDTNGNRRRVLTPQAGTIKMDGAATIVDVSFDQPFDEHPVVNLTPSKTLPNYDMTVTKTGFSMDFASAPGATIAYDAKSRRK